MNNLKIDRARLIEELRKTNDIEIQKAIKIEIDKIEQQM